MLRAYQYQFDLQISRVHLQIPFACCVQLWWRRGNKKIATKKKLQLTGRQKSFQVCQKLSMIASCQNQHGVFTAKPSSINIVIMTPGNPNKSGGFYNLQLTDVLKGYDPTNPISKSYDVGIQNCPTKNGMLHFLLSARCLQEITGNVSFSEQMSFHSTTPMRNTEITFREEERGMQSYNRHSSSVSELEFSFQQPKDRAISNTLNCKKSNPQLLPPQQQQPQPQTNQTFYQLLQIKRKLDQRNLQFAKLHSDYVLQTQKLKQYQGQGKLRDMRLMNEVNILTQQCEKLKRQLNEQTNKANQQANRANKAREEAARFQGMAKRAEELQSQVFHKQSELISLETMMSARLKEAVSSNEKLTETISSLNAELRTYYEKMKELERQKLVLETASLREREASELKIRALEDRSKEKDAVIDAVRKDFQRFAGEKAETIKRCKDIQQNYLNSSDQIGKLNGIIESLKQELKKNQSIFESKIKQSQMKNQKAHFDYENNKKQLVQKIQTLQAKIQNLQSALSQKDAALAEKLELMEKAKDYVNFKQEQIQKRDTFICKAKEYLQAKEGQLSKALAVQQQLKRNISSLESKLVQKDKTIESMNNKLQFSGQVLSQQKQKLIGDISNLRCQLQSKQRFLSEYLADLANSNSKVSELEQLLSQKDEQIQQLRKQLEEIEADEESRTAQAKSTIEQIMKQNVQYQVQIGIYAREVKHMQEQLCQAEKKVQLLESQPSTCSWQEKQNNTTISSIKKAKNAGLEISLERTRDKLKKMQERMSLLQAQNIALNVQLSKR